MAETAETVVETPLAPEDERKLFVGGLPQEAKDTDIKEYFGTFGEIDNVNLKTDPQTGRSRGFAFVVFKEPASLNAASADESHVIKGKKVTCKKAEARQGKIYVGKLPAEGLTTDEVKDFFGQHGTVSEIVRPVDKTNNDTPKNFAFITFEKEDVAKQLVKEGTANINGFDVEIKRVTPKDGGRGGMRGGFGGGYGGGYGDPYGMYGGGYGGYDPYGYGGGYGGYGGYGGPPAGGKMQRGGGRGRGRGRSRPY
jgi:squid-like protein